jgi:hypothetical protein
MLASESHRNVRNLRRNALLHGRLQSISGRAADQKAPEETFLWRYSIMTDVGYPQALRFCHSCRYLLVRTPGRWGSRTWYGNPGTGLYEKDPFHAVTLHFCSTSNIQYTIVVRGLRALTGMFGCVVYSTFGNLRSEST